MEKKIIITIGRQFGAGGKLGIPVYDSELITKASQDSGFSAELFVRKDEKRSFFTFTSIFANGFSTDQDNYMSENSLFKLQSATISKLAETGSAIIVGRCSDYILRDRTDTLDVFLTAPAEERARRVSDRAGIPYDDALEMLEKRDKGREEYYNYYTFGDWGKASNYDICVDSSILGIEGTAEFIIDFARKAGLL